MSIQNTSKFPERLPLKQAIEWATVCPTRSPEFKAHKTQALAMTAFSTHRPMWDIAVYHLEDGEWVRERFYEQGDDCEQCGSPMWKMNTWGGKRFDRYVLEGPGPAYEQPVVCETCYRISRGR